MDEFVKTKLDEWGLAHYKDCFNQNGINKETFLLIGDEEIKELFPRIGDRVQFKEHFKVFHENEQSTSSLSSVNNTAADHSDQESVERMDTNDSEDEQFTSMTRRRASCIDAVFDIKSILMADPTGEPIVQDLQDGCLTRKNRCRMVRILVAHLMQKFGDFPTSDLKVKLAKAIVNQYPHLKDIEGEGYEAFYASSDSKKNRRCATGYLEERIKNVRTRAPKPKKSRKENDDQQKKKPLVTRNLPGEELSEDSFREMKQWLIHNKEPKEQVQDFLRKTAIRRKAEIQKCSIAEIAVMWPRLLESPQLIEQDFREIFGPTSDKMLMNTTYQLSQTIFAYAKKQCHQDLVPEPSSDSVSSALCLQVLPTFLPTGRIPKHKKRATVNEALEAFVDVQPVSTNLPSYIDHLKDAGRTQPFVLLLGKRDNPSQVFVLFEGRTYEMHSVIKAIDVCFKVFYVFNLDYPNQCQTTWQFIQKVLYGIPDEKGSQTSPAIRTLRSFIQYQMNEK